MLVRRKPCVVSSPTMRSFWWILVVSGEFFGIFVDVLVRRKPCVVSSPTMMIKQSECIVSSPTMMKKQSDGLVIHQ